MYIKAAPKLFLGIRRWPEATFSDCSQVLSAMDTPAGCAVISIQECIIVSQASLRYI